MEAERDEWKAKAERYEAALRDGQTCADKHHFGCGCWASIARAALKGETL